MQHKPYTPLPWQSVYVAEGDCDKWLICQGEKNADGIVGDFIATVPEKRDADFIVVATKAVAELARVTKQRDEMLELLKEARGRMIGGSPAIQALIKKTDSVIANVEKGGSQS